MIYQKMCDDSDILFEILINNFLREYAKEKNVNGIGIFDPVKDLMLVRKKERELLKVIKDLGFTDKLKNDL